MLLSICIITVTPKNNLVFSLEQVFFINHINDITCISGADCHLACGIMLFFTEHAAITFLGLVGFSFCCTTIKKKICTAKNQIQCNFVVPSCVIAVGKEVDNMLVQVFSLAVFSHPKLLHGILVHIGLM